MNYNIQSVRKNLNKKGFFVIKNFLNSSDLDKKFINYLNKQRKICRWGNSWIGQEILC